jgi:hypothetical protein
MDRDVTIRIAGDILTINDTTLDFSTIPPDGTMAREDLDCDWIAGNVSRDTDGLLTVPVILPHGPNAPAERRFPVPVLANTDGHVTLPPFDAITEPDNEESRE